MRLKDGDGPLMVERQCLASFLGYNRDLECLLSEGLALGGDTAVHSAEGWRGAGGVGSRVPCFLTLSRVSHITWLLDSLCPIHPGFSVGPGNVGGSAWTGCDSCSLSLPRPVPGGGLAELCKLYIWVPWGLINTWILVVQPDSAWLIR